MELGYTNKSLYFLFIRYSLFVDIIHRLLEYIYTLKTDSRQSAYFSVTSGCGYDNLRGAASNDKINLSA